MRRKRKRSESPLAPRHCPVQFYGVPHPFRGGIVILTFRDKSLPHG